MCGLSGFETQKRKHFKRRLFSYYRRAQIPNRFFGTESEFLYLRKSEPNRFSTFFPQTVNRTALPTIRRPFSNSMFFTNVQIHAHFADLIFFCGKFYTTTEVSFSIERRMIESAYSFFKCRNNHCP